MQLPTFWLRQFANPDLSDTQLGEQLTMAGLELEEARTAAPAFSKVVVGEIVGCEKHPDADRLRVCQVKIGQAAPLQIVCGAPNARVGIRVPAALVGAVLPPGNDGKPFTIKVGKLRGVESQGMLCSAKELGIDADASGLYELPTDAPVGADIRTYLALDDTLLTLKLTPNLGHCLSVLGVAREVAAITGAALHVPHIAPVTPTIDDTLTVKVEAPDLCGRFAGRVVRGVNARAQTPAWMVQRLNRCGQRSVSALVDISNYVMFELGQPSHMFDLQKIDGDLTVRWAKAGERLQLLNGHTVVLDEQVGVIHDAQQIESLAGIMGGDATAVGDATQDVYIEAAFWWPDAIAGRARRFHFATDAGHRYERGVDPALPAQAIERITQLVLEICGGQAGPLTDQQVNMPVRKPVTLRVARAAKVLGIALSADDCSHAFTRLQLPHTVADGVITVTPPSYRFDLTLEEDLIEEVARMHGYHNLPTLPPKAATRAYAAPEAHRSRFALREQLAALGYQETINYSFVDAAHERDVQGNAQAIGLLNPIASQMNVMRSGLLPSLLGALKHNTDRKTASSIRLFEWGRVFSRAAAQTAGLDAVHGIAQPIKLGAIAYGNSSPMQWGEKARNVDFFDVKADVEQLLHARAPALRFTPFAKDGAHPALHPGRSAQVWLGELCVGWLGELHPKWVQQWELPSAPIAFELDAAALQAGTLPKASSLPRTQAVERDIALITAQTLPYAQLHEAIVRAGAPLLQDAKLFDMYQPKAGQAGFSSDEHSLAIRLTLRKADATLTDVEVDAAVAQILAAVQQLGVRLRA